MSLHVYYEMLNGISFPYTVLVVLNENKLLNMTVSGLRLLLYNKWTLDNLKSIFVELQDLYLSTPGLE